MRHKVVDLGTVNFIISPPARLGSMSVRRLVLNFLLSVMVALPLAVIEGRSVSEPQYKPLVVSSKPPPEPLVHLRPRMPSGPDLIDLAGRKAFRSLPPMESWNQQYDVLIKQVATEHRISPALVKAVIKAESNFNPQAISPMGAVGLMQIRPEAAKQVGLTLPTDPRANIIAGVKYLKYLLDMFEDDENLAVAAYNSGPTSVLKFGGVPPFDETRLFVARVMLYYKSYLDS